MTLCEFDCVSKWYGPVIGLNDVSLSIEPGITGLVGHNGAGKSTLIKLLTGQLRPSIGEVRIRGRRAWSASAKRHIGYCPDVDAFYEEMSGRAFVRTMAKLHGFSNRVARERAEDVLAQVGMTDRADRLLASYSKGMRQRIKLAQALVHDPDLIVLDEPLNGVDPIGRVELTRLFRELLARGKTILISSHLLDEMDALANRILFICRGRILASGSLEEIRALLDDHPLKIRIATSRARQLATRLLALETVQGVELNGDDELLLEVHRAKQFFASLADVVTREGVDVERLQVIDASTEAIFDYLMESANHPR
ncbi:MAG: ABC transporter ATP-binding protein [Planctomycetales bacterium]|nr:ABC transporter ATP-binding protein [Planctomycetales bacterium]